MSSRRDELDTPADQPRCAPTTYQGAPPVDVTQACLVHDRTLLVVIAGLVRGGSSESTGQDLEVYDITDVGPNSPPTLVQVGALTVSGASGLGKLRWAPPYLGYLEWTATGEAVNAVDLQTWLFAQELSTSQLAGMPAFDDPRTAGHGRERRR